MNGRISPEMQSILDQIVSPSESFHQNPSAAIPTPQGLHQDKIRDTTMQYLIERVPPTPSQ